MRLRVTRKTDLALRTLCVLAANGGRHRTSELAERVGTTASFLPQVMAALVRQGWMMSSPGPNGGYLLLADPDQLTVLDVVEAVEGPLADKRCVLWASACPDDPCPLHEAWVGARSVLEEVLNGISISKVIDSGRVGPSLIEERPPS